MNKITNELYKSIKYIVPVVLVFIGILLLRNSKEIITFTKTNIIILKDVLTPFIIGFIIAYILNHPMKFLERKFNLKRGICIAIIYGTLATLLVFIWLYLLPIAQSNIRELYDYLPKGLAKVGNMIENIPAKYSGNIDRAELEVQVAEYINNDVIPFFTSIAVVIKDLFLNIVNGVFSSTVNIFLGTVISIYLLLTKEQILGVINDLSSILLGRYHLKVKNFIQILDRNIGVYIVSKAIDSTIYGTLCTLLLYLFKSKYPLFLGLAIGVTNMIPFFGPIIGTIIAGVVNLFFSFNTALIITIILIVAQQLESAVLEPYIVGRQVGVPAILTILVVTLAGKYTGFFGMILSVPITGVLLIYIRQFIKNRKVDY